MLSIFMMNKGQESRNSKSISFLTNGKEKTQRLEIDYSFLVKQALDELPNGIENRQIELQLNDLLKCEADPAPNKTSFCQSALKLDQIHAKS